MYLYMVGSDKRRVHSNRAVKKNGGLIEMKVPEFLKDATNVYRTKNYIVKQLIG
jgi:hypothetical protein